jgi:1-acyl-sn-glycerol-3-phosphate acyltransferase
MILYRFIKPLAFILFKILFLLQVKGKENIPLQGGFILASNHQSFLDPVVLGVASPRVLRFMARDDLFKPRWFAWLITTLGAFPVKRNKPDKGAIRKAVELLRSGEAVLIFPEGTRSRDGSIGKGHPGCIWIAKLANVPLIPARIKGAHRALPVDSIFIRPYPIKVSFGEPFYPQKYLSSNEEEIVEKLMEEIRNL